MSLIAKLPAPPTEVPCDRSLDSLAPKFRARVEDVLHAMKLRGLDAIVAETLRTDERQEFLYGFGRDYDDGRGIVTHSRAATSWHRYGLACDIISQSAEWDARPQWWQALGEEARRCGLAWGGDWRMKDLPHVQFGPPMRQSPSPRAAELLAQGGMEAVWREVGAA